MFAESKQLPSLVNDKRTQKLQQCSECHHNLQPLCRVFIATAQYPVLGGFKEDITATARVIYGIN